jgi:hypothetical protein
VLLVLPSATSAKHNLLVADPKEAANKGIYLLRVLLFSFAASFGSATISFKFGVACKPSFATFGREGSYCFARSRAQDAQFIP